MELKKYILKMVKSIKDPMKIMKIYIAVKDIIGGQDEIRDYIPNRPSD